MRQIKQLQKGLKKTMLWRLLCQRPDVLPSYFPMQDKLCADLGGMSFW